MYYIQLSRLINPKESESCISAIKWQQLLERRWRTVAATKSFFQGRLDDGGGDGSAEKKIFELVRNFRSTLFNFVMIFNLLFMAEIEQTKSDNIWLLGVIFCKELIQDKTNFLFKLCRYPGIFYMVHLSVLLVIEMESFSMTFIFSFKLLITKWFHH